MLTPGSGVRVKAAIASPLTISNAIAIFRWIGGTGFAARVGINSCGGLLILPSGAISSGRLCNQLRKLFNAAIDA